jgi:thiamine biosynthesis protein ThiI
MPVYRPLLAMNKQEIIEIAKNMGTYETSKGPEICSILGPKHPATHAHPTRIDDAERSIDVEQLVQSCVDAIEIIDL